MSCSIEPVPFALVLRLLPDHLAEGEIAGWVEVPATGDRHPFRTGDELLDQLRDLGSAGATPAAVTEGH